MADEANDPPSTAAYIIICSGRTARYIAKCSDWLNPAERSSLAALKAASDCAAQLVSYLITIEPAAAQAVAAVSKCQHQLMEMAKGKSTGQLILLAKIDQKVDEMFALLAKLEKEFPGL